MDTVAGESSVNVLACILTHVVAKYDNTGRIGPITKFHSQRPPSVSIYDYMQRIRKYSECSTEAFIHALIYIDRLIRNTNIVVNSYNIHRILITSVMVASKYFDDFYYSNEHYSKIGGVSLKEINSLEVTFLSLIHYSLYVSPDEFSIFYNQIFYHSTRCTCSGSMLPKLYNLASEYSQFALLTYAPVPRVLVPQYYIPSPPAAQRYDPYYYPSMAIPQLHYA